MITHPSIDPVQQDLTSTSAARSNMLTAHATIKFHDFKLHAYLNFDKVSRKNLTSRYLWKQIYFNKAFYVFSEASGSHFFKYPVHISLSAGYTYEPRTVVNTVDRISLFLIVLVSFMIFCRPTYPRGCQAI